MLVTLLLHVLEDIYTTLKWKYKCYNMLQNVERQHMT